MPLSFLPEPGSSGSSYVALTDLELTGGLKLRDLPVSASHMLGLKACTNEPSFHTQLFMWILATELECLCSALSTDRSISSATFYLLVECVLERPIAIILFVETSGSYDLGCDLQLCLPSP